jgi:hypothetical protein
MPQLKDIVQELAPTCDQIFFKVRKGRDCFLVRRRMTSEGGKLEQMPITRDEFEAHKAEALGICGGRKQAVNLPDDMLPAAVARGTIRWFGTFNPVDREMGGELGAFAITFVYRSKQ